MPVQWTNMPIQIGQKRESDFSNPLGLLSDCHRRIERFLGILVQIGGQVDRGPLAADERSAIGRALAYFRSSAPRHTADEEESLFPRLRASGALDRITALEADHDQAAADHRAVHELFTDWLAKGSLSVERSAQLRAALRRLEDLYARHIAIEDQELFPLAASMLGAGDLTAIGLEMAARRGVAAQ
jgi:hemerythrin-like domain-containing protein